MNTPALFCQSCTMPIDNLCDRGTEKDGALSKRYCKYCYHQGMFTNPALTLEEMVNKVNSNHDLPQDIVEKSLLLLPTLERWRH